MQKVFYFIGSNNDTKELEKEKAESIISKYFEGFTEYEIAGFWKGNKEKTLKVEIITEESPAKLARIAKEIKKELNQESVLMEIVESNCAFL